MSDLEGKTAGQGEGQPGSLSPSAVPPAVEPAAAQEQGSQKAEQPTYVTREELEASENRMRSYSDKGRVRVENAVAQVANTVQTMRKLGQQVSPEQEQALRNEAIKQAMTATEPEAVEGAPAQATLETVMADPIQRVAYRIQQKEGVFIEDNDPELRQIRFDGDEDDYHSSIRAAVAAKKARLASKPEEKIESEAPAAARLYVPGGISQPKLSPEEKIKQGLRKSN